MRLRQQFKENENIHEYWNRKQVREKANKIAAIRVFMSPDIQGDSRQTETFCQHYTLGLHFLTGWKMP